MKIVKVYNTDFIGNATRKKAEAKLFAEGYQIESEEEVKEWDGCGTCCLAVIFLLII